MGERAIRVRVSWVAFLFLLLSGVGLSDEPAHLAMRPQPSSYITIDARAYTKDPKAVYRISDTAHPTVAAFVDHVYHRLAPNVELFTYGYAWVLVNQDGKVLRSPGLHNGVRRKSRIRDARPLSVWKLRAGDRLTVRRP